MLQIFCLAASLWLNNGGTWRSFSPDPDFMKPFRFVLLLSLVAVGASAQPARNPEAGASQSASEQRRAELREALNARPGPEQGAREQTPSGSSPNRHLSEQERTDLRQQLRQQPTDVKPQRP